MALGATASLVLAACISLLLFISAWRKMLQRGKLPPGPVPLPLVGNLLQMKGGEVVKYLLSMRDTYGSVFTVHLGPRRVVMICGYDAVKEALIDQGDDFVGRGATPIFERMYHDYGLFISNGERWKQLRQFSLSTMKNLGMGKRGIEERIQEETRCMVAAFRDTKGEFFDPALVLDHAAANVIFSIIVGKRFDYEDEKLHTLLRVMTEGWLIMSSVWGQLYDMFPGVMKYLPGPHNKIFSIFQVLEEFLIERVKENEATLDVNCPRDYIDSYLIRREQEKKNSSSEFHIKNLIPTIMDIILGGIETISVTMRYGILILLKFPDVEAKIREEIDREIGQHRSPSYEDRTRMPYTQAVIQEIQRFADVFPMGAPHLVSRNTQFRGYTIPKGTDVTPLLTTVLRDPTQFKDPENFNPGRFLDDKGGFKKHKACVPFSMGKRNCMGEGMSLMELFLFLTSILQNFTLKAAVDPKDIDLTPLESGLETIPRQYTLSLIPR